jgi:hypothetical protein
MQNKYDTLIRQLNIHLPLLRVFKKSEKAFFIET